MLVCGYPLVKKKPKREAYEEPSIVYEEPSVVYKEREVKRKKIDEELLPWIEKAQKEVGGELSIVSVVSKRDADKLRAAVSPTEGLLVSDILAKVYEAPMRLLPKILEEAIVVPTIQPPELIEAAVEEPSLPSTRPPTEFIEEFIAVPARAAVAEKQPVLEPAFKDGEKEEEILWRPIDSRRDSVLRRPLSTFTHLQDPQVASVEETVLLVDETKETVEERTLLVTDKFSEVELVLPEAEESYLESTAEYEIESWQHFRASESDEAIDEFCCSSFLYMRTPFLPNLTKQFEIPSLVAWSPSTALVHLRNIAPLQCNSTLTFHGTERTGNLFDTETTRNRRIQIKKIKEETSRPKLSLSSLEEAHSFNLVCRRSVSEKECGDSYTRGILSLPYELSPERRRPTEKFLFEEPSARVEPPLVSPIPAVRVEPPLPSPPPSPVCEIEEELPEVPEILFEQTVRVERRKTADSVRHWDKEILFSKLTSLQQELNIILTLDVALQSWFRSEYVTRLVVSKIFSLLLMLHKEKKLSLNQEVINMERPSSILINIHTLEHL